VYVCAGSVVVLAEESMNIRVIAAALAATAALGLAACEKKGPLEQAGEEVDEAVDTVKNGGEESTANKVDDAVDEAREVVEDPKN
jgi:predicted small lipoprotein YifL